MVVFDHFDIVKTVFVNYPSKMVNILDSWSQSFSFITNIQVSLVQQINSC